MSADATLIDASSQRRDLWLGAAIIVALTFIAYIPVLADGGFIWDDDSYVTQNQYLQRGMEGLTLMWRPKVTPQYYPVVFTTFWIENQLWGLQPRGYHVVNVLLHACNALLVWMLARKLRIPWPWLIAAIFALHPVHVESVAWITERKNTLSALFYLLAALAYLKFDDLSSPFGRGARGEGGRESKWAQYVLALLFFVLALLSKSVTCSLPAALILMMLWQRKRLTIARIAPLLPFFAIGLVLALNTAHIEREHVGATGEDFAFSMADRLIIASRALLFYPGKLIAPWPVMFIYPRWVIDDSQAAQFIWPAIVALIAIVLIVLYARGNRGPGLALAFFAGTIFPALGFVNVYPMMFSFVADHFQYLASLGVIALIVAAAATILKSRQHMILIAAIVLPVLGAMTWIQSITYHNAETVWRDTLSKNNNAFMPHNNLASELLRQAEDATEQGDAKAAASLIDEAVEHLLKALELKPGHLSSLSNLADARRLQGRYEEGLQYAQQAYDKLMSNPAAQAMVASGDRRQSTPMSDAAWTLGRLQELVGRRDDAIASYRDAIAWHPKATPGYVELSRLLVMMNREDEAAPVFEKLLQLDPTNAAAMATLAGIRLKQGRDADAADLYALAVETAGKHRTADPVAPLMRLVRLLATSNDPTVRDTKQAVLMMESLAQQSQRRDPAVLDVLASVLAADGRLEDAVRTAEEAATLADQFGAADMARQIRERGNQYRARMQPPTPLLPAGPASQPR